MVTMNETTIEIILNNPHAFSSETLLEAWLWFHNGGYYDECDTLMYHIEKVRNEKGVQSICLTK